MMELFKLEIDRDTRFLIYLDLFFLISIVSGSIIHELLKEYLTVHIAILFGLLIGLGGLIGTRKLIKKMKEKK